MCFPCPGSCLRIRSRETGSAVPARVSLHILHTQSDRILCLLVGLLPAFHDGVHIIYYFQPPSGRSSAYLSGLTRLLTDGAHCREFLLSRGPVVLEVIPITNNACCLSDFTMDNFFMHISVPTLTSVGLYVVAGLCLTALALPSRRGQLKRGN